MAIEQGIFQLIQSNTTIAPLLGSNANGQGVYWVLLTKGAPVPALVLSIVTITDTQAYSGDQNFRNMLLQVDCYAPQYYQARALSAAVRGLLEGWKGTLPDADSTTVSSILTTKDWDMPYDEGSSKGFMYRALLEFRIWYRVTE